MGYFKKWAKELRRKAKPKAFRVEANSINGLIEKMRKEFGFGVESKFLDYSKSLFREMEKSIQFPSMNQTYYFEKRG
ncbi:MAG: hypothetical protein V3V33_12550 [Candidatus Lokiarchaeia archaeon]